MSLKPLSYEEAFIVLMNHFLGEDWYVVDPLSQKQVNAIVVDAIISRYPKKKKWKVVKVEV